MGEAHRSRKSRKAKVNVGGSNSMEHGSKHAATSAELRGDRLILINEKIDRKMSEIQEIKTKIHEFDEGFYTLAWLSVCFKSIVLEIPDIGRPFQVPELQTRIKEELKNIFAIDPERSRVTEAHLMECLEFTVDQIMKKFGLISTQGSCHISVIKRHNTPEDVDLSAVLEKLNIFRGELMNLESQKENMEKELGSGGPAGQVK